MRLNRLFLTALLGCWVIMACNRIDDSPGWIIINTPGNVTASQGTYPDKVEVSWNIQEEVYYRVLRSQSAEETGSPITGFMQQGSWTDPVAESGRLYYYQIQGALNNRGGDLSDPSEPVAGYAGSLNSGNSGGSGGGGSGNGGGSNNDATARPGNVDASDGDYSNRIRISWEGNGAAYFQVWRSTSSGSEGVAITDWRISPSYSDWDVDQDVSYYYRVRGAKNSDGDDPSDLSGYNRGYAGAESCEVPDNVEATDGAYSSRIRVSWDGDNCDWFQVYRSTSRFDDGEAITDWIDDTYYNDRDVDEGEVYYYRVMSAVDDYGEGASELSDEDAGYLEDSNTGGGGGGGGSSCLGGFSGDYEGSVKITSPYTTYNGNDCEIEFDPDECTFKIHTPRTLFSGTYTPAPRAGDISLVWSSYWVSTDDNEWALNESSFNAASVYLPVNNLGDQALLLASGAEMRLEVNGSDRKIIIDGTTESPYQMDVTVTITF